MNTDTLSEIFRDFRPILNERLKTVPKPELSKIRKHEIAYNPRTGEARLLDRRGEKLLLSKTDVAELMSVSVMSVNRYLKAGLLPSVQLGGRRLIPREGLIEMIAKKSKMEKMQ